MHTNHQDIKSRASEFLLSGPRPDLEENSVHAIATDLVAEINEANDHTALITKLSDVQERSQALLLSLNKINVMAEFRQYSSLILQEQLLTMAQCVEELKNNTMLENYPPLVRKILRNCPQVMPQNLKIYTFLKTSVDDIRQRLLSDFHKKFEAHLLKSEELTHNPSNNRNGAMEPNDSSWECFLASARGWILAYTMISLLPAAARGCTSSQLLEAYQECLDSAFTPLWGRFYFHLTSSRDAGSMEQILWTFEYTHTFIHLLLGFCTNLTTFDSDLVLTFPGVNFRQAGIAQIIEKTCRFMRSHVAECLVILNPLPLHSSEYCSSSSQICMSLIEHSLLLDHDIHKFQHGIGEIHNPVHANNTESEQENRSGDLYMTHRSLTRSPLALPVSAVFCSNPIVRNLWLHFDHVSFRGALADCLNPRRQAERGGRLEEKYAASLELGGGRGGGGGDYAGRNSHDGEEDLFEFYFGTPSSQQREGAGCFACVYDCLILFHKAYQRYAYLPSEAQDLFSAYVLEPLLLSALGLIMFRTNTCSALTLVFNCHRLPFHLRPGSIPEEGLAIVASVQYLRDFLVRECDAGGDAGAGGDVGTGSTHNCGGSGDSAAATTATASLLAEDGASFLRQQFCGTITPPTERFAGCWELLQAWIRTPDRRYVPHERQQMEGSMGEDVEGGSNQSHSASSSSASVVHTGGVSRVSGGHVPVFSASTVAEKAFQLAEAAGLKLRDRKKQSFLISSQEMMGDMADVLHFTRRESALMSEKLSTLLDEVSNQSADIYLR